MMEEGYYSMQFINQSGQLIQQKDTWIDSKAKVLNLDVPTVAAGSYFIMLKNRRPVKNSLRK